LIAEELSFPGRWSVVFLAVFGQSVWRFQLLKDSQLLGRPVSYRP